MILDILLFLFFICIICLLYFPLNIYELLSMSYTIDPYEYLSAKYKQVSNTITIFKSKNIVYNEMGTINVNIKDQLYSIIIKGNRIDLDLIKDKDKIIPIHKLLNK